MERLRQITKKSDPDYGLMLILAAAILAVLLLTPAVTYICTHNILKGQF